jgi:maltose alpha-D-glucosyltransferase/alpha-amylase
VPLEVEFADGEPETWLVMLGWTAGGDGEGVPAPRDAIARLTVDGREGILQGGLQDPDLCRSLVEGIRRRRRFKGNAGEIAAHQTRALREHPAPVTLPPPVLLEADQSNSSVQLGDWMMLKVIRRLDDGIHPELEVGMFLTEKTSFRHAPSVAGWLEYRTSQGEPRTLGLMQSYVPNEGDLWSHTLDVLGRYYERIAASPSGPEAPAERTTGSLLALAGETLPDTTREIVGLYLETARLLGQRTAELHRALVSRPDEPAFAPEPFTLLYQRSLYQALRDQAGKTLDLLRRAQARLDEPARGLAGALLARREHLMERYQAVCRRKIPAQRARVHGDYHLGQVLYTGRDVVIIDFEGEPSMPLSARRIKRSPLKDVAGMLRSFHYAGWTALDDASAPAWGGAGGPSLEDAARFWIAWVSSSFLRAYLATASEGGFLPPAREDVEVLLDVFLLEKGLYEVAYELNHRPDKVRIPLAGLMDQLGAG